MKKLIDNGIDPKSLAPFDRGMIKHFDGNWLESLGKLLEEMEGIKND